MGHSQRGRFCIAVVGKIGAGFGTANEMVWHGLCAKAAVWLLYCGIVISYDMCYIIKYHFV